MPVDDSFKKPGAIPFNWEIRPGVPKIQQQLQQKQPPPSLPSPSPSPPFHRYRASPPPPHFTPYRQSSIQSPRKLKPPPISGSHSLNQSKPRTNSFRSVPRSRSERWRFDHLNSVRPESVSQGCFLGSLLGRKENKRIHVSRPEFEPDYTSDLDALSRWSVSSRKSLTPLMSNTLSPRSISDSDWASFGLF
ncbi:hypothetical protein CFOL_v3_15409 [Cephalotus follicularis]|uniref:DUF688 domain-containing protein n=1 Tax=Cephalotus follicularis TaxID=3775 RepID=A0A1Q3BVB9_CEPFO|nr:hypothetical protein CFOL_v3_15409 [Cephalotus follicularis]